MLKPQDIEIVVGRATGGDFIGDFMRVVHKPTGISLGKGPPLLKPGKVQRELLRELELELIQRGLAQHLLPDKKPNP